MSAPAIHADASLAELSRLIGTWATEATHRAMPGVVVRGTTVFEWLEGQRFLIQRAQTDHPDFPDSISIIGVVDDDRVEPGQRITSPHSEAPPLHMHYYDSRGVFRDYELSIDATTLRIQRLASGFSQRFTGTFGSDRTSLDGVWQLCEDGRTWHDDLKISYRRRG